MQDVSKQDRCESSHIIKNHGIIQVSMKRRTIFRISVMQPDSRIRTDCFTAHFVVTLRFYSAYSAGSFRCEAHIY